MFTKKINLYAFVVLFVGLLFTSNAVQAQAGQEQSESPELEGKVIDTQTSQPVQGIVLTIKGTDKTAETDAEGKFSFTDLEPGTYTLISNSEGYQEVLEEVQLTASGVKTGPSEDIFTIELQPSGGN